MKIDGKKVKGKQIIIEREDIISLLEDKNFISIFIEPMRKKYESMAKNVINYVNKLTMDYKGQILFSEEDWKEIIIECFVKNEVS